MNDAFIETNESPIHATLDPEPEVQSSGWLSRETYIASVRQLTDVNRTITGHLRAMVAWFAAAFVVVVVLAVALVVVAK